MSIFKINEFVRNKGNEDPFAKKYPIFVNTITGEDCLQYGKNSSEVYLNCKELPKDVEILEGDIIQKASNIWALKVLRIETIVPDYMFSHYKIVCKIVSNYPFEYIEDYHMGENQFFFIEKKEKSVGTLNIIEVMDDLLEAERFHTGQVIRELKQKKK